MEKPPFFAGILLFEKPPGVLRQFDKAHAFFEIGTVGALVALDVAQAAVLLRLPFGGDLLIEGRVDGSVELVDIGGVDSVLEPVVFGAQPFDGLLVFAPFVGMAIVKGVPHPIQHLIVEC